MQRRWKYENELKYSPKTESRDREIEFAFTCNSWCYAPFHDAGSLPLYSCGNEASKYVREEDRGSVQMLPYREGIQTRSGIARLAMKAQDPKTSQAGFDH